MISFRSRSFVLGIALFGLLAACGVQDGKSRPESVAETASALTGATTVSISADVAFPAGYGLSSATIGAAHSLEIGDNARILDVHGSPGIAANSGSGAALVENGVSSEPSQASVVYRSAIT